MCVCVTQVSEKLKTWLGTVQWTTNLWSTTITLPYLGTHTATQTQLSILNHIQFSPGHTPFKVALESWPLTESNMALLASLPEWECRLDISECTWPLEHAAYEQLAVFVPVSYKSWSIGSDDIDKSADSSGDSTDSESECDNDNQPGLLHPALMHAVCRGIDTRREGLGLPPLAVFDGYQRSGTEGRKYAYKHVVVKPQGSIYRSSTCIVTTIH